MHLAQQRPDCNIVGLEIANKPLSTVERRLKQRDITNVRVIFSTAETALYHLLTPGSVREFHINFPDPWFKTGHAHRRVMQRDTLDALTNRLEAGGLLFLATDIIDYAEMSHKLLHTTPGLTNTLPIAWATSMPGRAVTKYEAKAAAEGRQSVYFRYQRNDVPAPNVPILREEPMPNLVFRTSLQLDDIFSKFQARQHVDHDEGVYINLMNVFRNDKSLLFEVYIKEPTIDQHIGLILTQRSNAPTEDAQEYTLKLSSLGKSRPTLGVHQTAALIARQIFDMRNDVIVLQNKIRDFDAGTHPR